MSSCAASYCTCSRKVSCASETSASWPTASVPPPCHFAFICSARHRKPSRRPHPQVSFGSAPNVVDQCWSSKGLRLLQSSFVLRPSCSPLPHETTHPQLGNSACFFTIRRSPPCRRTNRFFPLLHTLRLRSSSFSASSSPRGAVLCASPHSFGAARRPTFPPLNLHRARIRRSHGRLPSSRCIESAPEHHAFISILLLMRASDTSLGLLDRNSFRMARDPGTIPRGAASQH